MISHVGVVWGAQKLLLDLAPRMADRGVEWTLAAPPGEFPDAWRRLGLPTRDLMLASHRGFRDDHGNRHGPATLLREAAVVAGSTVRLAPLLRRYDAAQTDNTSANLEVALAGRAARRPTVLQIHDIVPPGPGRRVLRLASRLAGLTVANSAASAAAAADGSRDDVVVVHPSIDLDRFRPGPPDPGVRAELAACPGEPLVVMVGRVDPRKGVDVAVRAVAELRRTRPSVQLAVVGAPFKDAPEWLDRLHREAAALGEGAVRFTGPRTDVEDVLRAADVFVNCSAAEPFGLSLVEAMACGRPVVATAAGGPLDFVVDGVNGRLVPPDDPRALAAALDDVLGDAAHAERLARSAVETAARFDIDRQADRLAELQLDLAGAPS